MKLRDWLLVAAYLILVGVVTFGAFYIEHEFSKAHDEQCQIARAQAEVTVANGVHQPGDAAILNDAIRTLNKTCDFHIEEVQ